MTDANGLSRAELIAIIVELRRTNGVLAERVEFLEAEVERLRSQLPGGGLKVVPEWVKPNRKERREQERSERKKRKQSFVRRRDIPTEVHEHALHECPKCGRKLYGGWLHRIIRRKCGVCGTQCTPKVLLEEIRGSPVVNADETGWREDGINGYIWSFSTPKLRYFVYRQSRSGQVAKEVLGAFLS